MTFGPLHELIPVVGSWSEVTDECKAVILLLIRLYLATGPSSWFGHHFFGDNLVSTQLSEEALHGGVKAIDGGHQGHITDEEIRVDSRGDLGSDAHDQERRSS